MIIRGTELDFDFFDANDIQKWSDSRKKVSEKHSQLFDTAASDITSLEDYAQILRKGCQVVFDLFDELFGEDTSNKLFGVSCNFSEVMGVYNEFEQNMNEQLEGFQKKISKYQPVSNKKGKK